VGFEDKGQGFPKKLFLLLQVNHGRHHGRFKKNGGFDFELKKGIKNVIFQNLFKIQPGDYHAKKINQKNNFKCSKNGRDSNYRGDSKYRADCSIRVSMSTGSLVYIVKVSLLASCLAHSIRGQHLSRLSSIQN
jgi:hypothetical protein